MLARMLEAEGFECFQAVDGLAAVAFVSRADLLHRYSASGSVCQLVTEPLPGQVKTDGGLTTSQEPSRHHSPAPGLPPVDETREQCAPAEALGLSCQQSALANQPADCAHRSRGQGALGNVCVTPLETPRHHDPPDIVLMDSNMPKMNGPDAIVEIRKMGYTFPIFGVTGDEDRDSFMRAGADGVMMKPVRAAELVKTIHAALRKSVSPEAVQASASSTSGAMSPRVSFPARRNATARQENAAKMEGWLAAHPPAAASARKSSGGKK